MWHVRNLLLCVFNRCNNGGGELFERVCQRVLFFGGLARSSAGLGVGGDVSVRIQAANGAVAFLQDTIALFDLRLDILDKLFLVEFLLGLSLGSIDELKLR